MDKPINIWKLQAWKPRAGVEIENIYFFGKNNSFGLGPRVVATLPWELPYGMKVSAVTTYQLRTDKNFVRVYIFTNMSFSGK